MPFAHVGRCHVRASVAFARVRRRTAPGGMRSRSGGRSGRRGACLTRSPRGEGGQCGPWRTRARAGGRCGCGCALCVPLSHHIMLRQFLVQKCGTDLSERAEACSPAAWAVVP
eukprot:gene23502-biopygen1265